MKILIANDKTQIVDALRVFLEDKGLSVDCAFDGGEALELIKGHGYDIVFLDVSMPVLSGIEIAKYIKENHFKAAVIFLTDYPTLTNGFCKSIGVNEYLREPVDMKAIEEIIDKYTSL